MLVAFTLSPAATAFTISSCSSGFNSRFIGIEELSHCSTGSSTGLIVSSPIPYESMVKPVKSPGTWVEDSSKASHALSHCYLVKVQPGLLNLKREDTFQRLRV